ncbi:MAG: deoxyribodipyrimidine photo-lyase [Bacteroidales bacterium]
MRQTVVIFWFRRDLRLEDNTGLWHALSSGYKVLPVFIYDRLILDKLESDDPRLGFISGTIDKINLKLLIVGTNILTLHDTPLNSFRRLLTDYDIKAVYFNKDYEPYALCRDKTISELLAGKGIPVFSYKDQVIFESSEIVKSDGKPYTVYTPYSRKWLAAFNRQMIKEIPSGKLIPNFLPGKFGTEKPHTLLNRNIVVKPYNIDQQHIRSYNTARDFPGEEGTSFLGPHLRFGTISIREVIRKTIDINDVFIRELIWREFFMQILFHFPHVVEKSFRPGYDRIVWKNNEEYFERWCNGLTGFPIIDAGMRELLSTGYMHNRVRMIAANFLTRHLLTDWRWGEAWFASKLLDFDLASNNGNWQWAAGSGCDAAPYFRIFNPVTQQEKFDPYLKYIRRWVPEAGTTSYVAPVVDLSWSRGEALAMYKEGLLSG